MSGRDRGSRGRGDRGGGGGGGRGRGGDSRGGTFSGFAPRARGSAPGPRIYRPAKFPPSEKVTKVEQDYVERIKSSGLPDLSKLTISDGLVKFPPRPGYGTKGADVILLANYFELKPPSNLQLYRYELKVTERSRNQENRVVGKKLKQVFQLVLELPPFISHRGDIVTDFKSFLISRVKLDTEQLESLPDRIQYRPEGEDQSRTNDPFYNITVTAAGSVAVSDLTAYLTSTDPGATFDKQPILQALNIFLGHYAKNSPAHTTVGANRSFSLDQQQQQRDSFDLGTGLRAIRGFFSSVRVATARILVNVNISHAAFYDATPLETAIRKFSPDTKLKLQAFLKRLRVEVNHLKPKTNRAGKSIPRIKTIFGLANKSDGRGEAHPPQVDAFGAGPASVKFWYSKPSGDPSSSTSSATTQQTSGKASGKKGKSKQPAKPSGGGPPAAGEAGTYITVSQYFKKEYGRELNPRLPVVNVGTTANPSYIPAEVCSIVPGQSSQAKLDPDQTARMIEFAVRRPWINAQSIEQDGTKIVGLSPERNPDINRFGVTIDQMMITVPGRKLNNPQVKYKLGTKPEAAEQTWSSSWNQNNRNRQPLKFNTGKSLPRWTAVMINMPPFGPSFRNPQELVNTMNAFKSALTNAGVTGQEPLPPRSIPMSGPEDSSLEAALREAKESLLLVILPIKHTVLYNRVKHIADTKAGLHTICVVADKLRKGHPSYFSNVALKFNLKLGGVNQKIDDAKLGIISEGKTMVVGIDVTHPSPGSAENAQSVAGMAASIDKELGQWPAVLRLNGRREKRISEQVTNLDVMLQTRLELWRKNGGNGSLPQNILIYRDGVSEGQYSMVLEQELPQLRKACERVYPATDTKKGLPHISIVVVGKRHHTRFFATSEDPTKTDNKTDNPQNGTVVDRHVTEACNWDFYLQSHKALQGTARPAHYFVVLDEIFTSRPVPKDFKNNADVLEDLTHNMCYLFGRATKAVSICPPAYYADLVCERARCYLAGHFDMGTPMMTPAASEAGDGGLGEPTENDITIHPRLKDTMFYI